MAGNLETRYEGRVLIAINADPETRNALSWDFTDAFREAVEAAGRDHTIGAIVLTGANGFFCSGGNINALRERSTLPLAERRASVEKLHAMIRAMRACPKPIVAAIEGGAAGAGASLALACDLIVAARDAYVSIAYVKIGLTPDGGSTAFLGRAVPRQMLAEMAMTGDRIPVARLHALGVVNDLVAPGAALESAVARGKSLAEGPRQALAAIKGLIDAAPQNTLGAQLALEADSIARAIGSAEGREGLAAFLEKRKPVFRAE